MGINIIIQTNEQECGVCVLTALHNHFYNKKLDKECILEESSISSNGMTIFDFESLGAKLGIECESYEAKFNEFINLKISGYFVMLLMTNSGGMNHYVIARKRKQYIEIYDSCSLQSTKMSYEQLKQIFLNVIILVKKKPNEIFNKLFNKASTLLMIDLKFILLNLSLSLLIMAASIGGATFLNFIIDLAIAKSSINNLVTMSFIFIFLYFANDILNYISHLYMSKQTKNYSLLFTNKILSCLSNKSLNFTHKVDMSWIFKVDECVYTITNFCIVEVNKFITNIIFLFVCICIVGSIQYYLLIFVVIYLVIEFIFFLFSYRKKKEIFLNIVRSENTNTDLYKNLIYQVSNELWQNKKVELINQIKNNYSNIFKNYTDVILFKGNTNLFKSLLKSLCDICIVATMSIFIIKNDNLTIGQLTFIVSAFSLFQNTSYSLFTYFLARVEFEIYWQVYKDITTVGNMFKNEKIKIDTVQSFLFKTTNKEYYLTHKNEKDFSMSIIKLFQESVDILINDKIYTKSQDLLNQIIVCDENSRVDVNLLLNYVQQDPITYSKYLQYFNLDLNTQIQSTYLKIIVNLLCLLDEKNKIIFIDNVLPYVKNKDKLIVKGILNKIKKNNNVFVIGKETND